MKNDLESLYDEYLDNNNYSTPHSISEAYNRMDDSFMDYLNEVLKHEWQCGYRYAMEKMQGGNENNENKCNN